MLQCQVQDLLRRRMRFHVKDDGITEAYLERGEKNTYILHLIVDKPSADKTTKLQLKYMRLFEDVHPTLQFVVHNENAPYVKGVLHQDFYKKGKGFL